MYMKYDDGIFSPIRGPKWYRKLLVIVIIFSGLFVLFCINYNENVPFESKEVYTAVESTRDETFTIKTKGCHIPVMQSINDMIQKFVWYPKHLHPCPNAHYSLLEQNGTHIWVNRNTKILRHYKVPILEYKNIECCYSSLYRPDQITDINSFYVDDRIKYNECSYFNEVIEVKDEFVSVTCNYDGQEIYKQYFPFAPFKKLTLNNNDETNKDKKESLVDQYNVLVVGIDNLSRLNFYRTMPKTAAFMKHRGAVEMMGYNKVGDNSFPNLVPLLMGYAADEIKEICHPMQWTTYDDCPFLWHWYKDAGFYTAFGEDSARLGTFNYIMKGFRKTPTDYYLHPFISEAERVGEKYESGNVFLCLYEHYFYQILLDYIKAITDTLWENKLFGFFWETTMSHDYLNYPMLMDESYLIFFKQLEDSGYLDKTIIFLISDHGLRWGSFRETKQGYLEERLPLTFVLTPPSFRENYTEAFNNLQYNSKQLTTPFDLHETLLDLIHVKKLRNDRILERMKDKKNNKRGISLFLKVPEDRTCESAGISDQWCACFRRVPLSNTSVEIMNASNYLVEHLNLLLSLYPQCMNLQLDGIEESTRIETDLEKDLKANWTEYSVAVKVKPSGGVFEATLRSYGEHWSVIGSVSRKNLYRNQSYCVNDTVMKLYCYCREIVNHNVTI